MKKGKKSNCALQKKNEKQERTGAAFALALCLSFYLLSLNAREYKTKLGGKKTEAAGGGGASSEPSGKKQKKKTETSSSIVVLTAAAPAAVSANSRRPPPDPIQSRGLLLGPELPEGEHALVADVLGLGLRELGEGEGEGERRDHHAAEALQRDDEGLGDPHGGREQVEEAERRDCQEEERCLELAEADSVFVCLCVCVCMCVRRKKEEERKRKR